MMKRLFATLMSVAVVAAFTPISMIQVDFDRAADLMAFPGSL